MRKGVKEIKIKELVELLANNYLYRLNLSNKA